MNINKSQETKQVGKSIKPIRPQAAVVTHEGALSKVPREGEGQHWKEEKWQLLRDVTFIPSRILAMAPRFYLLKSLSRMKR